jgi:hypothetical protein
MHDNRPFNIKSMKQKSGPISIKSICAQCVHWLSLKGRVNEGIDEGECRRYPPSLMENDDGVICLRPITEWDDTCGEFKMKHDA